MFAKRMLDETPSSEDPSEDLIPGCSLVPAIFTV